MLRSTAFILLFCVFLLYHIVSLMAILFLSRHSPVLLRSPEFYPFSRGIGDFYNHSTCQACRKPRKRGRCSGRFESCGQPCCQQLLNGTMQAAPGSTNRQVRWGQVPWGQRYSHRAERNS